MRLSERITSGVKQIPKGHETVHIKELRKVSEICTETEIRWKQKPLVMRRIGDIPPEKGLTTYNPNGKDL